jgi:3-deoxy-D-manno-octulosonate 8-phosphate phosphatase KdsC-like HAD superfamily phosphatase
MSKDIYEKAKNIKLVILDVDGVMTDGSIILDN